MRWTVRRSDPRRQIKSGRGIKKQEDSSHEDRQPITQRRAVTRRLQACVGQAATEALSVKKDKSWRQASLWHSVWSGTTTLCRAQLSKHEMSLFNFLSTSFKMTSIKGALKLAHLTLAWWNTVKKKKKRLPLAQGQRHPPFTTRLRWNNSAMLFLLVVWAN